MYLYIYVCHCDILINICSYLCESIFQTNTNTVQEVEYETSVSRNENREGFFVDPFCPLFLPTLKVNHVPCHNTPYPTLLATANVFCQDFQLVWWRKTKIGRVYVEISTIPAGFFFTIKCLNLGIM